MASISSSSSSVQMLYNVSALPIVLSQCGFNDKASTIIRTFVGSDIQGNGYTLFQNWHKELYKAAPAKINPLRIENVTSTTEINDVKKILTEWMNSCFNQPGATGDEIRCTTLCSNILFCMAKPKPNMRITRAVSLSNVTQGICITSVFKEGLGIIEQLVSAPENLPKPGRTPEHAGVGVALIEGAIVDTVRESENIDIEICLSSKEGANSFYEKLHFGSASDFSEKEEEFAPPSALLLNQPWTHVLSGPRLQDFMRNRAGRASLMSCEIP